MSLSMLPKCSFQSAWMTRATVPGLTFFLFLTVLTEYLLIDCLSSCLAFSNPSYCAQSEPEIAQPWCYQGRLVRHTLLQLSPLQGDPGWCHDYSSWALNGVRCGGGAATPQVPHTFLTESVSAEYVIMSRPLSLENPRGLSLCGMWVLLRVSHLGEEAATLEMFAFAPLF